MEDRKWDDRIFDAVLTVALKEFHEKDIEKIKESIKDIPTPHYSERHKKRMKKLLRKSKHGAGWGLQKLKRVAIIVLLVTAITFGSMLTVEAVRAEVWSTIMEWTEKFTGIRFENNEVEATDSIYRPTYLPKGFTEYSVTEINDGYSILYNNENDIFIVFEQYPKNSGLTFNIDNENVNYLQRKLNGTTVHIYEGITYEEGNLVYWENSSNMFCLTSEVKVSELLKIIESIK